VAGGADGLANRVGRVMTSKRSYAKWLIAVVLMGSLATVSTVEATAASRSKKTSKRVKRKANVPKSTVPQAPVIVQGDPTKEVLVSSLTPRQLVQFRGDRLTTVLNAKTPDATLFLGAYPLFSITPWQIVRGVSPAVDSKCSDPAAITSRIVDVDNNKYTGVGDVFTNEVKQCSFGPYEVNATVIGLITSRPTFVDNGFVSGSQEVAIRSAGTLRDESGTSAFSAVGVFERSLTPTSESIKLREFEMVSPSSRTVWNVDIDVDLGSGASGTPYVVRSISGTGTFDGVIHTITSTPITGTNRGTYTDYRGGSITATGPNRDVITLAYSNGGQYSCTFTPSGSTAPSIVIDRCNSFGADQPAS
jgi:hypothetical protein